MAMITGSMVIQPSLAVFADLLGGFDSPDTAFRVFTCCRFLAIIDLVKNLGFALRLQLALQQLLICDQHHIALRVSTLDQ